LAAELLRVIYSKENAEEVEKPGNLARILELKHVFQQ
jgi:hypothetical protein